MWTCPQCEYLNEDLDAVCARCSTPRQAEDATVAAATPEPPAPTQPPRILPEPDPSELLAAELRMGQPVRRKRSPAEVAAGLIAAVSLLGLLGVGYLAWQRGMLDGLLQRLSGGSAVTDQAPKVVAVNDPNSALNAPADDPLKALDDDIGGLGNYRKYAEALREVDKSLATVKIEGSGGALSEQTRQQLYELASVGDLLLDRYNDFEGRAARENSVKLAPYIELLRAEFLKRMDSMLTVIGQAYALEDTGNHPVYMLSDTFATAIESHGGDAKPLRDRWLGVIHSQEQRKADIQYASEHEQLAARLEAFKLLHRKYQTELKAMPEYRIRGGYIGDDAKNLLAKYDALATDVEKSVVDFEALAAALPAKDDQTDKMKQYVKEFTDLAQQDHFFSFQQVYAIYEQDRELTDPAYANLRLHYDFAKQHWAGLDQSYMGIASASEHKWAEKWATE